MPNGPITVENISESFKSVTNMAPDASSLQMLQRLPCLGRFESGSENRVFVDEYVLDGIRGEDVADIITSGQLDIDDRGWKHPINSFGAGVASHNIEKLQSKNLTLQYLRSRSKLNDSGILNGDVLSILLNSDHSGSVNCSISNTHILNIDLSEKNLRSLHIEQSLIDNIYVGGEDLIDFSISESHVTKIIGAGSRAQVLSLIHI